MVSFGCYFVWRFQTVYGVLVYGFVLTGITSITANTAVMAGYCSYVGFYHTVLGGFLVLIPYSDTEYLSSLLTKKLDKWCSFG